MTEITVPLYLSRGRHAGPSDGACLMEMASLLAGEPWGDHPACVHPVLAAVARAVNDKIGDEDRATLAPLVPGMIGTAAGDPASSARLVLLCAEAALAQPCVADHVDICCEVEAIRRLAQGVLCRTLLGTAVLISSRLLQCGYPRRAALHATLSVAAMTAAEPGDRAILCDLLKACVLSCRPGAEFTTQAPGPRELATA